MDSYDQIDVNTEPAESSPVEGATEQAVEPLTTEEGGTEGLEELSGTEVGEEAPVETKTAHDSVPYDRFSQKNDQWKEAQERAHRAELEVARLRGIQEASAPKAEAAKPDYEDITQWDDDVLRDKFDENPKAVLATVARQVEAEVLRSVDEKQQQNSQAAMRQTTEQQQAQTYRKYADGNPDFEKMWDSGEIKRHMNENPGNNAISSHLILTAEARTAAAVKKAQAEMTKNMKTKQGLKTLGSGPSTPPSRNAQDERLNNSSKHGGDYSVLVKRMEERQGGG